METETPEKDSTIIKRDMSNFKDGLIFGKRPDVEREAKKLAGIK